MQITLTYTDLYGVVERSLSIIAKRSVDDQGNLLFDNITLGSRETSLIYDYFRYAITGLAAELRQFVTLETPSTDSYVIGISLYSDANPHLEDTIKQAVKDYIVAFALYSWFTVSAPRIYEKYLADAKAARDYVVTQVYHRQRPSTMPNPLTPKSET